MPLLQALVAALVVVASIASGPVTAQTSKDQGDGLQEVVVTAQKREQQAHNVPIALSVFNTELLKPKGIDNVRDVGQFVPNVEEGITRGEDGYPALRMSVDRPAARIVAAIVESSLGQSVIRVPALGSAPMGILTSDRSTPVIGAPIANFDNDQHAADENIRLQNLWSGIEVRAGLIRGSYELISESPLPTAKGSAH